MAKKGQAPKKKRKSTKKKFFEVKIPLTAAKAHLYGYEPEDFNDKVIKIDLTKSLRGKSLELKAKIKASEDKLSTELLSLQLIPSHIKRVMRRGTDYVEDSFETTCKDAKLRVKPFMITRRRVSRAVRKAIREIARKQIEAKIKVRNTEEIFSEIMTNKFQKELSLKVKKIYPLGLCEIRYLKVLGKIKPKETKTETKNDDKNKDPETK